MTHPSSHPLTGIRVLDMSRILAGPWAGQALADLGADVIKIERPGAGDDTRGWGPPYLNDSAGNETAEAAYFTSANRGKRSVTVDITQPAGQDIIKRLAAVSDVLIENYKMGGLAKYGLDYEGLRAVNPRLVYCSITGFGQTGPYAKRAGYDFMIQGMAGLMSVTGKPDSEPGGGPVKVGVALSDVMTGLYSVIAIQAALMERAASGEGQHIDMALFDTTVAALANQTANYLVGGMVPGRLGNAHPNIVPYEAFATADGHMILAVGNDAQFSRFCDVAGQPALAANADYATNRARVKNREVLVPLIRDLIAARTSEDWLAALEAVGVPCGPINTLDQVFADPQAQARELAYDLPHPLAGSIKTVGMPVRYSRSGTRATRAAPTLGQHTDEVLAEVLEMDAGEIEKLKGNGTI